MDDHTQRPSPRAEVAATTEEEATSNSREWLLLGLSALNASAFVGMLVAKDWAGCSHDATALEYDTPLTITASVRAGLWNATTLSLLAFVMWPFLPWLSEARKLDIQRLTQPFVLACVSHTLWSVLWAYGFLSLSALISVTVCFQLMAVSLVVCRSPPLFRLPLGLWLGWAAFSALGQISAALAYEAHFAFFDSVSWSVGAMILISGVAYTWGSLLDDPFFSAGVALSLFGVAQGHYSLIISRVAYTCCIAVGAHALICLINACDASRRDAVAVLDEEGDEYDQEEAAVLLSTDGGSPVLPSAPLLSLPVEDSQPLYPAIYAPEAAVYHPSYTAAVYLQPSAGGAASAPTSADAPVELPLGFTPVYFPSFAANVPSSPLPSQ